MASRKRTRKTRKLPVVLTDQETKALLEQVNPRSLSGLRDRAILASLLGAGLRVSEVVKLYPADVDFAEGTIRVNDGKGGKDRVIPVDGETLAWLSAWAEKRKTLGVNGRQPFFCRVRDTAIDTAGGKEPAVKRVAANVPLNPRTIQALVTRLAAAAEIDKRVHPHVLRHTYASRLLDQGCTIREVQDLLGHADVSTTMIYTHVNPAALKAKIQGQTAKADLVTQIAELRKQLAALEAAAGLQG